MLSCAHNEYMLMYMPFACCDMPLARVGVSAAEVERLLPLYEEGISVHPSPWRGKENMGSMRSAPLGGIIMLKQGQENAMRRVKPQEAVAELFMQFLFTRSTPLDVRRVCALEERLLQSVPVWQLVNRGDEASARLCHDTLAKEMYNA